MKMIFFNIAWMTHYRGITDDDQPLDGGTWADKHEVCNFAEVEGRCYGFVQPPNGSSIAVERIAGNENAVKEEGVTVIWTAKSRTGGTVIVGFYRNATVHRERQKVSSSELHQANKTGDFFAECESKDAILIPHGKRRDRIPRGKDAMGQSLVWYADTENGKFEKSRVDGLLVKIEAELGEQFSSIENLLKSDGSLVDFDDSSKEVQEDISEIFDGDFSETEKTALIRARLGQGKFRRELLLIWRNSCAVTGCSIPAVLRASHIKPWRDCVNNSERLSSDNGIILSANLDALFDRGLIGFDIQGKMLVSNEVAEGEQKRLGLNGNLTKRPSEQQAKFLSYHREMHGLDL